MANHFPRMICCVWALTAPGAAAPTQSQQTIRVVMDDAYAPFAFKADDGALQGILVDQWQAWERQTGIKAEIHAMDWADALKRMRAGEFDVIDSIVETPARLQDFDFTPAYAKVETAIFFRSDVSGISNLASLRGFPVGVKTGDQHVDLLRENGVGTVVAFPSNDDIVAAAQQRKINVFVADIPSAIYLLNKFDMAAEFRHSPSIFGDELRRAVNKGNVDMLQTVSAGFAAIDPDEIARIDRKWYGSTVEVHGRYLRYAAYASILASLLVGALAAWNRSLSRGILARTAQLSESEARLRQIAQDVRVLSEERETHLRLVIDTIPTMAWSLDSGGTVDFVNQRWLDYAGLSVVEALDQPASIVHPDDLPSVLATWAACMATGESCEDEMRLRRRDGQYRWGMVRTVPLRNAQGEVIKWYGTSTDIEDRKRAESETRNANEQLQALSRRLVDLQESERKGLSRELHDRIGQNLTALGINIEILRSRSGDGLPDLYRARLQDCAALVDATADSIENLMSELRPPLLDDHGLLPALDWHGRQFTQRTCVPVEVSGSPDAGRAPPAVETALFRIAQEALTNVAKHACARRVDLSVERTATQFSLSIEDDGLGFDATALDIRNHSGLGMATMRERTQAVGGQFDVVTAPGAGTRIIVRIPC